MPGGGGVVEAGPVPWLGEEEVGVEEGAAGGEFGAVEVEEVGDAGGAVGEGGACGICGVEVVTIGVVEDEIQRIVCPSPFVGFPPLPVSLVLLVTASI